MTAVQPSASIVREPDRVRDFLRRSRPSRFLDIAVTRQRSGRPTFIIASIGIIARQEPNAGTLKLHAHIRQVHRIERPAGWFKPAGPNSKRYRAQAADSLLADLHGPPAIAVALNPNLALAPVAARRQLGIARTRSRIINRRGWWRRIVVGRWRRRRTIGDGAADNRAGSNTTNDSGADGAAIAA